MLLFVSLLPFTTSLMTTYLGEPGVGTAVAIYDLDLFIASLLMNSFISYAARAPGLVADEVADEELEESLRQRRILVGIQGAAVLLALLAPNAAVFLYLLISVAFLTAPLLLAARGRRSDNTKESR